MKFYLNLVEEIKDWVRDHITIKLRNLQLSVKNLIRWFPIIWRDRDWDDSFIFDILSTKLKFHSKYTKTFDGYVSAQRDSEIMDLCVKLLERVKEDYYGMEYIDYYKCEYNFVDSEMEGRRTLEINVISENFDEYFKKYPIQYKKLVSHYTDSNGVIDKKLLASLISTYNHKRCKKLLFKLLENNIENWWT